MLGHRAGEHDDTCPGLRGAVGGKHLHLKRAAACEHEVRCPLEWAPIQTKFHAGGSAGPGVAGM